jgi:hypothetical protein
MISKALKSLYPETQWKLENEDYNTVQWFLNQPDPLPTLEQLQQEAARLEEVEISLEYQRKRRVEYPPVTDYLDAVVKGDQEQMQAYIDACLAVKAKYPKEA